MRQASQPSAPPTAVPSAPISVPCSTKTRMTAARDAPMDTRIAMSLCFSITIRISVATMLSAATMTMRPMVMPIATFSSHSAENRLSLVSIQSVITYPSPSASWILGSMSRTRYRSSTLTSTSVTWPASPKSRWAAPSGM